METGQTDPTRVLLVDDDSDDYVLTRDMLEDTDRDYRVTWVSSCSEAIAAMDSGAHEVCLVSWRVRGESGLDLLREARQRGSTIPAILLTSRGSTEIEEEEAAPELAGCLVKYDMSPTELERRILAAMQRG